MAGKPTFTAAQFKILQDTAKKLKKGFVKQEQMALALGITQQSLSALLAGKYKPGVQVAANIANLAGQTLEDLVGPYAVPGADSSSSALPSSSRGMANLDVCIQFHRGMRAWSPWTVEAARAGYFGPSDFHPSEWPAKLDTLEQVLRDARPQ